MTTFTATYKGRALKVRAADRQAAEKKIVDLVHDLDAGIVKRSRNRETGTTILLVDRELSGAPDDGNRWETICEQHATVCSHETRTVAESFMPVPTEWCEDCQAAFSTDGKGTWDDFA